VEDPCRAHGGPACQLALKRQCLRRGLHPQSRELIAQEPELARRRESIAADKMSPHQGPKSVLVRRLLAQHLLPPAVLAHEIEPPPAQARPHRGRPLGVVIVREQVAAVGGVVPALEALHVGRDLGLRRELHHA
jgi:hypothetical protein